MCEFSQQCEIAKMYGVDGMAITVQITLYLITAEREIQR